MDNYKHLENRENYSEFYENIAENHGNLHLSCEHRRVKFILDNINDGDKVLELGCQDGGITQHIANKANLVVAVEVSENNLKRAPQLENVNYVHGYAEDIDFHHAFQTVIACELLEHVFEPMLILTKAWEALERGGRLLISTPNKGAFHDPLGEHVREYTKETLKEELELISPDVDVKIWEEHIWLYAVVKK